MFAFRPYFLESIINPKKIIKFKFPEFNKITQIKPANSIVNTSTAPP